MLLHVGNIVRVDQNTFLHLKGKFVQVCVDIDITKPLPGSITITRGAMTMRVLIIYERLHEVCPLCGGESHQLDLCPKLRAPKKIEVFVEKFDNQGLSQANKRTPADPLSHPSHSENWVTVAPKRRVNSMINPRNFRSSNRPTKATNTMSSNPHNQAHPPKYGFNLPQINNEGPPVSTTQPTVIYRTPNPAPANMERIILANLNAMVEDPPTNAEALDDIDEGMNEDENIDMYLNLHLKTSRCLRTLPKEKVQGWRGSYLPGHLGAATIALMDFFLRNYL